MRTRVATHGFSIMELLIAIIIMGILVAIIVPRYATRTEEARKKAALEDLVRIKDAQQTVEIDTGFLFLLSVLDDVGGGDGIANDNPNDRIDGIQDEQLIPNNSNIAIDPFTGEFANINPTVFYKIAQNETKFGWAGPYITWQTDTGNDDIPEDPWGNDYLFFTQAGLVDEQTRTLDLVNGKVPFDRFTVLSLGPDGFRGSPSEDPRDVYGTGDDIMIQW